MPARRSLQNYRQRLARKLNSLSLVTTDNAGNANKLTLIASQLANSLDANRYLGAWVFGLEAPIAGELRRVKAENALNTTSGELTVARAFSAQVSSGTDVEIHRLLPPEDDDGWMGLRTCLNLALAELWQTQRVALTGVGGQPTYSLSTYAEWLDPEAIQEVYGAALASDLPPAINGGFTPYRDADIVNLEVSPLLDTGEAAKVAVFRPGDTWIKVGATWASSTVGLVNETDEALFQPDFLVEIALAHAYEALAVGSDAGRWEQKAKEQRLKANVMKMTTLDHSRRRLAAGSGGWGTYDRKSFWGTVLD